MVVKYIFCSIGLIFISLSGKGCNPKSDLKCAYLQAWKYKDVNLDSAHYFAEVSKSLVTDQTSIEELSKLHTVIGIILQYEHRFEESVNELNNALAYKLQGGDSLEIAKGYNNIGTTLIRAQQFKTAKQYFINSLHYLGNKIDSNGAISTYSNLAICYKSIGKTDSALVIFKKAESYVDNNNTSQFASDLFFNLSKVYRQQSKLKESIEYLNKAVQIQKRNNDKLGLAKSYLNLGVSYHLSNEFNVAYKYYLIADSISIYVNEPQLKADIRKGLFLLPLYINSSQKELERFYRWYELESEIIQIKINSDVAEVEAIYQTKLKDEEVKLLKERSEKAEAISERNYWLAMTGGGLALSLAGIGYFVNKNRKQKHKIKEERMSSEFNEALAEQELAVITKSKDAKNKEKLRISTEIHDNISSKLTAISTALQSEKPIDKEQLKVHLKDSMKQLRTVAHDLANEAEMGNTMEANLLSLNQLLEGSDIEFKPYLEGLPKNLDPQVEKHLFRIVMELMNNSLKHAKCSEIVLDIMKVKEELVILFEDNGIGFDPEKQNNGFGLNSIEKRIAAIDAELTIDSKLDRGSTFIIKIPLV